MQARYFVNESKAKLMLMIRNRGGNLLSNVPPELTQLIMNVPMSELEIAVESALVDVAFGNLEELKKKLENNPQLVLARGNVITPAGLEIRNTTLLECAIGAGDPDMVAMIKPYFSQIGAEKELELQLERYREVLKYTKYGYRDLDLTSLIETIKVSSHADIVYERWTGKTYFNKPYQSKLRDALNQFREERLDPRRRLITVPPMQRLDPEHPITMPRFLPPMHCNYQNLIHAYEMLEREWENLRDRFEDRKVELVVHQIIGFIQLVELPAYERFVFTHSQSEQAVKGEAIKRSFQRINKYVDVDGKNVQYDSGFPLYDNSLIKSHVGLGFEEYMEISKWGSARFNWYSHRYVNTGKAIEFLKSKYDRLVTLVQPSQPVNKPTL